MDIDADKVDKMKVAELRAMLSSHDLDTKGTKPVLVSRLKEFLAKQGDGAEGEEKPAEAAKTEDEKTEEAAPEAEEAKKDEPGE